MSAALDFGVQSYCFREFKDNADVAAKVREIGLDKIELCGVHANFQDPSAFPEIVRTYREAGVAIISLGVENFTGDVKERKVFECAAFAGAKHISVHFKVDSFPAAIKQAQKLADEFGIRLGIHCHGGYSFGGQLDVLDHLIGLGSPQIGLCLDTAWRLQTGPLVGRPIDWVKRFAGRVHGVHYKDFAFAPNAQWRDTVIGEGNLDLAGLVQALDQTGFDGMAVLEYEADAHDPVPALKECVKAMRRQTVA